MATWIFSTIFTIFQLAFNFMDGSILSGESFSWTKLKFLAFEYWTVISIGRRTLAKMVYFQFYYSWAMIWCQWRGLCMAAMLLRWYALVASVIAHKLANPEYLHTRTLLLWPPASGQVICFIRLLKCNSSVCGGRRVPVEALFKTKSSNATTASEYTHFRTC